MSITIIQAQLEHLELVAPLFDAYRVFYEQSSDLSATRAFIQARLENDESIIFLAVTEQNGQTIGLGFTQLYPSFSSVSMQRQWILNDLFVASTARKQGVGQALMDRARQLAIETGAKGLILSTAIDNYPAQRLYESLRYQRDQQFYHYSLKV